MAYKTTVNLGCANRAEALTEIDTKLQAMGWVLHDDQSASSYKVYKSNGELADRIPEFVKVDWATANTIKFQVYYFWNATTHTGLGMNTATAPQVTTSEAGFYLWIYGNKNFVSIWTKVSTTYYTGGFGHLPKKYWTTETYLTAAATSGTNVTITVASTSGFIAGQDYQIIGAAGEGRDKVNVSSILSSTQMIISSLPRNYDVNSKIGSNPSTFGGLSNAYSSDSYIGNFLPTCPFGAVGTTNMNSYGYLNKLLLDSPINPDLRGNSKFCAVPLLYGENINNDTFAGYMDEYLLGAPNAGLTAEDTFGGGTEPGSENRDSGTSSGNNTSTTLNDTTKSWTTDAFAGKVVIIKFGTGVGQIRKISSNTATTLTIAEAWATIPDNTSQYVIADEGYRYMKSTISLFCREGV